MKCQCYASRFRFELKYRVPRIDLDVLLAIIEAPTSGFGVEGVQGGLGLRV